MAHVRELITDSDWNEALLASKTKPILLLKHSTTCPISASAWNEFQAFIQSKDDSEIDSVYVKVIESRALSNVIAAQTEIKHESPQVILFVDESPVWSTSHWSISKANLEKALLAL